MDDIIKKQKEILGLLLKKNILINPTIFSSIKSIQNTDALQTILDKIEKTAPEETIKFIENKEWQKTKSSETILDNTIATNNLIQTENTIGINYPNTNETDKQHQDTITDNLTPGSSGLGENGDIGHEPKILVSYSTEPEKRTVEGFVSYFTKRYQALERMLRGRQKLQNTISIARALTKSEREQVSIIGLVKDRQKTKNNNTILTLEDPTGEIKVVIGSSSSDLAQEAEDTVLDEVVGIVGALGNKIIFGKELYRPDVAPTQEMRKSPDEAYAIFLSDIHVGSNNFLDERFQRFLRWINQETGSYQQKEMVKKIRYMFIVGDLVDGVGIYPGQENELLIKDIYRQYDAIAELLSKIPKRIKIIICPGNHDAMRIAEPQPIFFKDFAKKLHTLTNVTLVSNPARVKIHQSKDFDGLDVLLYHGYSFDHYVANVDSLRQNGGYDRADLIMKFLLQRRHLAPTHTSTLYVPDAEKDHLVIETVPDFFATGHIHKCAVATYRGVTMICGSTWQSTTAFQEKVGHKPEPARVPIINLQTRKAKILRF